MVCQASGMQRQAGFVGYCAGSADLAGANTRFNRWAETFAESLPPACRTSAFSIYTTNNLDPSIICFSASKYIGLFLGELYYPERLAAKLGIRQRYPATLANARLLSLAYEQFGPALGEHLEGLFALVVYQPALQQLLLMRDSSSAYGLYYHADPQDGVVFASHLDRVVAAPGITKHITRPACHEYLRFLDISAPNTIYAGVYAVEPGTCVSFRDLSTCISKCMVPFVQPRPHRLLIRSLDNAITEVESHLQRSIEARTQDAARIGVLLSGGIDSALICSIAAELLGPRCEAVTVGFADPSLDESSAAAALADYLGLRHHRLCFDDPTYLQAFEALSAGVEYPFADPAGIPSWLLFEYCDQVGLNTVLDGTGADTLVGMMPARHTRLVIGSIDRLPRSLRCTLGRWLQHAGLVGAKALLDYDEAQELLIRWRGWTRRELQSLFQSPVSFGHTRFYQVYAQFHRHQHYARYSALLGSLPDDRVHQCARAHGITVRFPFWDACVEAAVDALPRRYRYRPDEPKRILRRLLQRRLPKQLWNRPKHGFDFPFAQLLRHHDHYLLKRYLQPPSPPLPAMAAETIEPMHHDFLAGNNRYAFKLWALVMLNAWLTNHDPYTAPRDL